MKVVSVATVGKLNSAHNSGTLQKDEEKRYFRMTINTLEK